jgi:hypothetical protein
LSIISRAAWAAIMGVMNVISHRQARLDVTVVAQVASRRRLCNLFIF